MALQLSIRATIPRRVFASVIFVAAAGLVGCQSLQTSDSFLGVITPYRIEIVQGNVITSEQAALVKPGMNRAQVREVRFRVRR